VEGFQFDSGFISSAFITDEKRSLVHFDNPLFYVSDFKIETVAELMPVLEIAARANRPLVIISEEITGQALAALIMNTARGTLKVAAIKAPRFGQERREILSDISLSVGAEFITRESGFDVAAIQLIQLGEASSIEISRSNTIIVGGKGIGEKIMERIEILRENIKANDNLLDCQKLQERITRLASAVAIIYVGGATELEALEKKYRIEDALEAVKSAQQEGVTVGGGYALLKGAIEIERDLTVCPPVDLHEYLAKQIVSQTIVAPFLKIISQLQISHYEIRNEFIRSNYENGYDANSEEFVNLREAGIMDPVKVVRVALLNAFSIASIVVGCDTAIIEL
jgi:chaperonin GroEL